MPKLTVSLIGLPGAGKTTLARSLAERLGWQCFILGDRLRERAAEDPPLKEMLGRGELAPESIALELIRAAAADSTGQSLILDGFPRHVGQIRLGTELFHPLTGLYLDVPPEVAAARLARRKSCRLCGWAGTTEQELADRCPGCQGLSLQKRPEDEPESLSRRIGEAEHRLRELLSQWVDIPLIRINASVPAEAVVEQSILALMSAGNTQWPTPGDSAPTEG